MGKPKKEYSKKQQERHAAIDNDERFAAAHNRPQFRVPSKYKHNNNNNNNNSNSKKKKDGIINDGGGGDSKIVLDDRFASVLTDSRFQIHEKDKYGRKQKKRDKERTKEELGAFYTIAEKDDDNKDDKDGDKKNEKDDASTAGSSSSSDSDSDIKKKTKAKDESDDEKEVDQDPASRIAYLTALSRGELNVSSASENDSDEDDSSDDDDDDDSSVEGEDPVYGTAGVLDPSYKDQNIEITHEASKFLAVTNMDWSHMRASDVFAILSSFAPPGAVKRVQVYVSDFGKEKMAKEFQEGPGALWKKEKKTKVPDNESGSDNDDDSGSDNDDDDKNDNNNDNNDEKEDQDDSGSEGEGSVALEAEDMDAEEYADFIKKANEQQADNDFDAEKLRLYEASKLKYYFAVAEFTSTNHADIAYKEVDGMEFEHSSAAVDMRSIPEDALKSVLQGRDLRDEATSIPGNYVPPDFIVTALQQTNVQCSWEAGDAERERTLTKYSSAEQWASMAKNDDLKAYLASDNSSDEDSDEEGDKGSKMRKLLGLDGDSDSNDEGSDAEGNKSFSFEATKVDSGDDAGGGGDQEISKQIAYVPGQAERQEKIRTKLQNKKDGKDDDTDQLTPWEKYEHKRKEKKLEKRKASRKKRRDQEKGEKGGSAAAATGKSDGFFMDGSDDDNENEDDEEEEIAQQKPSKEELELLLAGDNDEEVARDFDMRGIQRIDKNKDKKLRGPRKRKEAKVAAGVSGQEFAVDVKDDRFAAVLDGADGKFGIDRTDPQYKETQAMRDIMDEQKVRRKKKRKKNTDSSNNQQKQKQQKVPPNVVEGGTGTKSAGSSALSSLVMSLKTKVANKPQ